MNCLCCNKPLLKEEESIGWHKKCIKNFFNKEILPSVVLDENKLNSYFLKKVNDKMTITGVQKKMSLNLTTDNGNGKSSLSLVDYPTGYILKPQVSNFEYLPEFEHLTMSLSDISKIKTVPHALIKVNDNYAYITKRIDRVIDKNSCLKIAMEDFCQLDLRLTEEKYNGSYERCFKIIKKYSSQVKIDSIEMFCRVVFSYLVGNSDMHLKNFSLIEDINDESNYKLSPSYDVIPVNIIDINDKEQMALTLNGKKKNITRNDIVKFGISIELDLKVIENILKYFVNLKEDYNSLISMSLLPKQKQEEFINLINTRMNVIDK